MITFDNNVSDYLKFFWHTIPHLQAPVLMKIHSISKVLALPLIVAALAILYYTWNTSQRLSVYIFIPVILLVVLYVFHGPLDHGWLKKFPVPLDPKLSEWLSRYFRPYAEMQELERQSFDQRMMLYLDGRLFQSVGSEMREVPEDIKCMVAAHGVHMTSNYKDYLIGEYDRVFLYKHPFPTPNHPFLHTVEVNHEDGVIILSLEQLTNAVLYPSDYFNIGYYAYGLAFMDVHKQIAFPDCQNTWMKIEDITGWSREKITCVTGMEVMDLTAVHISVFFTHKAQYKSVLPSLATAWDKIFPSSS